MPRHSLVRGFPLVFLMVLVAAAGAWLYARLGGVVGGPPVAGPGVAILSVPRPEGAAGAEGDALWQREVESRAAEVRTIQQSLLLEILSDQNHPVRKTNWFA